MAANTIEVRGARGEEVAHVAELLAAADLPLAGFGTALRPLLVAVEDGRVVGGVALERYGADALLRSLVVTPAARGRGVGERLTEAIVAAARAEEIRTLWLLTTTAERFFPRFGFERVERSSLPAALAASAELRGACPASAVAMRLAL